MTHPYERFSTLHLLSIFMFLKYWHFQKQYYATLIIFQKLSPLIKLKFMQVTCSHKQMQFYIPICFYTSTKVQHEVCK